LSGGDWLKAQLRLQNIEGQLIVLDYVVRLQAVPVEKIRPISGREKKLYVSMMSGKYRFESPLVTIKTC
jgi:hypothetical protein